LRDGEFTTIPVRLVACTTQAWAGLVGEEAAAHSRLVPTETPGAAMRTLLQTTQATAILWGTSKAPAAADLQIRRRFPLFPVLLLPDDPSCDELCYSNHASTLGACPPRITGGHLPGIIREATERARLSSPAGLLLGRLLVVRPELSLLARRFRIACLTSEPAVRRPNAVAAQLRVSLRTMEREYVEEGLSPPGRCCVRPFCGAPPASCKPKITPSGPWRLPWASPMRRRSARGSGRSSGGPGGRSGGLPVWTPRAKRLWNG